jgi:hypothetical protein
MFILVSFDDGSAPDVVRAVRCKISIEIKERSMPPTVRAFAPDSFIRLEQNGVGRYAPSPLFPINK